MLTINFLAIIKISLVTLTFNYHSFIRGNNSKIEEICEIIFDHLKVIIFK